MLPQWQGNKKFFLKKINVCFMDERKSYRFEMTKRLQNGD